MRTRTRKMLSLLLATAMVFTMNTFVFADEAADAPTTAIEENADALDENKEAVAGTENIAEDDATDEGSTEVAPEAADDDEQAVADDAEVSEEAEPVEEEAIEEATDVEVADDAVIDAVIAEAPVELEKAIDSASKNALSQNFYLLSQNAASVSANLQANAWIKIGDYIVVYPNAYAYNGPKDLKTFAKGLTQKVKVYSAKNKAGNTLGSTGFTVSQMNAMVSDNTLLTASLNAVTVKKVKVKASKGATVDITGKGTVTVGNSFYISGITLDNKTDKKAFNTAYKSSVKSAIKSGKKTDYVSANGARTSDTVNDTFERKYPTIAIYPAFAYTSKSSDTGVQNLITQAKLNKVEIAITQGKTAGTIKKAQGTLNGKKVTLKPTKKEAKPLGLVGADLKKTAASKETDPATSTNYYVETNGNFVGWLAY